MNCENDKYLYDTYCRGNIGDILMSRLTKENIQDFYIGLIEIKGIDINVVQKIDALLHEIFLEAMAEGRLATDPTIDVMKAIISTYSYKKPRRHSLTPEQEHAFTSYVLGKDNMMFKSWVPLLTVMLGTGCRTEEVLALTWEDVDMDAGIINIDHKLTYRERDHVTSFKIEPARFGHREVPMLGVVAEAFKAEKQRQRKLWVYESEFNVDGYTNFVFLNENGNVHAPYAVNQQLHKITNLYNNRERYNAKKEDREPFLLPHISAHNLPYIISNTMLEMESDEVILKKAYAYQQSMMVIHNRYTG